MTGIIRAEIRKLLTTRLWWGLLLAALGLTALEVCTTILGAAPHEAGTLPLSAGVTQRMVVGAFVFTYLFAIVVAILMVTSEFRHLTTRPTFLMAPRRAAVISAKLIVAAAVGAGYGLAAMALDLAIAVPWMSARGVPLAWAHDHLGTVMLTSALAIIGYAVIGVGVGLLLRHQVAAIAVALFYLLIGSTLLELVSSLSTTAGTLDEYLPQNAVLAFTATANYGHLIGQWQGGLVLLGWCALFALAGVLVTKLRDIP